MPRVTVLDLSTAETRPLERGASVVYVGSELPENVPYLVHARDDAAVPFDPDRADESLVGDYLAVEIEDGVFAFCEVVSVE